MEAVSTFSEASERDNVGICLQRALEKKVQRLCNLLNAEDLKLELDRVVCCLVKMAVRSAKRKRSLSSALWLQCKMYDLLSLTERAVQHRQQYFIDTYPLPSDGNESTTDDSDIATLTEIKEEPSVTESIFLGKYNHLLQGTKDNNKIEEEYVYQDTESEVKSDSITLRTCEDILKDYSLTLLPTTLSSEIQQTIVELNTGLSEESLKEVRSKDQNEPDLPNYNVATNIVNKSVTNTNDGVETQRTLKRDHKNKSDMRCLPEKTIKKRKHKAFRKVKNNTKGALSISKIAKNNIISRNDLLTNISLQCSSNHINTGNEYPLNFNVVSKPMWTNTNILSTASVAKPIPLGLIQFSKMSTNNTMIENSTTKEQVTEVKVTEADVAATKESLLIDIVMEDANETIALRRTIGTDLCNSVSQFENEMFEGCDNSDLEITPSQAIFVFDINEPSTSKGIRHYNLDAQCGSDTAMNVSGLNTLPDKRTENSRTDIKIRSNCLDFGTCTNNDNEFTNIITSRVPSKGIVIKDSLLEFQTQEACLDFNTYTQCNDIPSNIIPTNTTVLQVSEQIYKENIIDFEKCVNKDADCNIIDDCDSSNCELQKLESKDIFMVNICDNISNVQNDTYEENCSITKLLKPVSSKMKVDDSVSEFCTSIGSSSKSPVFDDNGSVIVGVSSVLRQNKQRLACGLVQLHNFKEKQTSEDVVYQGRWQQRTNKIKNMSITNYKFSSASKKGMIFDKSKPKPSEKLQYKKSLHKLASTRINEYKFTRKSITIDVHKPDRKDSLQKLKKTIVRKRSNHKLQRVCAPRNLPSKGVQNVQQGKTLTTPKNFIKINKNIFDKNTEIRQYRNKSKEPSDLLHPNLNLNTGGKELKKELLKPTVSKLRAVTYLVLQNKPERIDNKHISRHDLSHENSDSNAKRNSCSSVSASSSCSSPNSVVTVRVAPPIRHHSLSPTKKHLHESEKRSQSYNSSSCSSRVTNKNKADVDDSSDSNISYQESFNKLISNKLNKVQKANEDDKPLNNTATSTPKSAFIGKNKRNIYVAKLPDHKTSNLTKSEHYPLTTHKSVCKKLNIGDVDEPAKVSVNNALDIVHHNPPYSVKNSMFINDLNVLSRQIDITSNIKEHIDKPSCSKVEKPLTETPTRGSTHSLAFVRGLIESRINLAVHTPIKSKESVKPSLVQVNSSKMSLLSKNNPNISSDYYLSSSSSKDISYKASFKSMNCYKPTSEHWLAETDLSNNETTTCNCSSFEDTAVAKYPLILYSSSDSYLVDSSVTNAVREPVNIIDSETGSVATDTTRQMVSDELNISSRSSGSYQSCQQNEESVPNWLYQMIAEQESEDDQPESRASARSVPTADSLYDRNGNLIENTVGAGAGAGDGRGVHSDYSHDSSGHGTSLSSSNTNVSSGRLSEALTIDPSSINGTYDLLRDSNGGSIRFQDDDEEASTSHFHDAEYGDDRDSSHCRLHREPLNRDLTLQSDFDADVSSLDTDVPDSSDN